MARRHLARLQHQMTGHHLGQTGPQDITFSYRLQTTGHHRMTRRHLDGQTTGYYLARLQHQMTRRHLDGQTTGYYLVVQVAGGRQQDVTSPNQTTGYYLVTQNVNLSCRSQATARYITRLQHQMTGRHLDSASRQ